MGEIELVFLHEFHEYIQLLQEIHSFSKLITMIYLKEKQLGTFTFS